jgi:23S rRNA pseudouridine1911/1915/1917 synthase
LIKLTVPDETKPQRLDKYLADSMPDLSRSRLKGLILEKAVIVDGSVCINPAQKVRSGTLIRLEVPPPSDPVPKGQDIALDVVFEDECMLVINKPVGLVVHPGAGNHDGTLVNALIHYCGDQLSGIGGVKRPGIVHRLDKNTSGLLVVAKNDRAHKKLSAQLVDRSLSRVYQALCWRVPDFPGGHVDAPIGRHPTQRLRMAINRKNGREARTDYKVSKTFDKVVTLFECKLESGRTHQVRVHMESINHPLIGDPYYHIQPTAALSLMRRAGWEEEVQERLLNFPRQALHAWKIGFIHPMSDEYMQFEAPLPDDFQDLISIL